MCMINLIKFSASKCSLAVLVLMKYDFFLPQDEDSMCNKLCTFTLTQKEFMHQHWYHCHTCRMVDGVGVCTVCARVCHRGHDVTYAKYGAFFCDCGAKEDGSCQVCLFLILQNGFALSICSIMV